MPDFLRFLTDEDRQRLLANAKRVDFDAEEVILAQGERRDAIFVLESGEARVERSHGEFHVEVSRIGTGEVFGEMGFVEGFEASASIVADRPSRVAFIDADEVRALIDADPGFYGRFYQSLAYTLSQRLRETTIDGIAEFSWGGRIREEAPGTDPAAAGEHSVWGGGSPVREV